LNDTDSNWTCADSAELYGIDRWGSSYFSISRQGEVEVITPTASGEHRISLRQIVHGLEERGLEMPLLLRLENLIEQRINELYPGFNKAIESSGYRNRYQGVFPIKVNQQGNVVQAIVRYGNQHDHGLEAGSKAELLIAMATLTNTASLIICNGYKDAEFIDLGLQARKLGLKCIFVIETLKEVPIILDRSAYWGVDPLLGIRLKLSTKADGQWATDSGDRSLFGLTSTQITQVLDQLKAAHKLNCLQLLHFHLGSQIPNIRNIRNGVREACRYFISIAAEGADLKYLDLGGGLGIDYDGTGNGDHSVNYTLDEYCSDVVEAIQESLDPHGVPHPIIITESGRAVVAPMSVLLFNILDV
jgi:arginine decarboxylase